MTFESSVESVDLAEQYAQWPGFEHILLQDSWVLAICETPAELQFFLEVALLEGHDHYKTPSPTESHCFQKAVMIFSEAAALCWKDRTHAVSSDANGELDLGHIDAMYREGTSYIVEGDFGIVMIDSAPPILRLEE